MLFEKTLYEEGAILVFKLVTGDEIVTKIISYNPTGFTIKAKQPLQLHIVRTQEGQAKTLVPFMWLCPEGNPTIELSSVVAVIEAPKEVSDAWQSETSGLIIPGR